MQPCLFCGGDAGEPDHRTRCDGRQGVVEAATFQADRAFLAEPENYARATDPATSHAAAASVTEDTIRELHAAILQVLRMHPPLSDEQIRERLFADGVLTTPSGARTRRSELVHAGVVKDSGLRGTTKAGRPTILWTACKDAKVLPMRRWIA